MNAQQRQRLLQEVERLLAQAEGEQFDALDEARLAIKQWDLQGPIPYEKELRQWGIDLDRILALGQEKAETERDPCAEVDLDHILRELRQRILQEGPDADTQRRARKALRRWQQEGCAGPLPYAQELRQWGIWPPAEEPEPELDDPELELEFGDAQVLLREGELYQAVKNLEALRPRASGPLAEQIANALDEARTELQRRTQQLVRAARRVQREQPKDVEAQEQAWLAVLAVNPDAQEAKAALKKLEARLRKHLQEQIATIRRKAEEAARSNHLPALNEARTAIEALASRPNLPEGLREEAEAAQRQIKKLLDETRDRLGVASTKAVQGDLRGAYLLAREYLEKGISKIVDKGGALGQAGAEVDTQLFFDKVAKDFLEATRGKVQERLRMARQAQGSNPEQAMQYLEEARGWLTDEVWTLDHRNKLSPALKEVEQAIDALKTLLERYRQATEKITQARAGGLPARERMKLLREAEAIFPGYPDLEAYFEEARQVLANELASQIKAAIVEAKRLARRQSFSEALARLQEAREQAMREIPNPRPDSALAQAFRKLEEEEAEILDLEQDWHEWQGLLEQAQAKLQEYEETRDPLILQNAHILLEQIPGAFKEAPETRGVQQRLAAFRQDRENYRDGQSAYEKGQWREAIDYFEQIQPTFAQYAEVQTSLKRAQAAIALEEAREAEQKSDWETALWQYGHALALFEEAGEDAYTRGMMESARQAKERLEQNEREVRKPLKMAQDALRRAKESIPPKDTPLLEQLEKIHFDAIVRDLEKLLETPSILDKEIRRTLREAREAWREAYLPALQRVAQDDTLGEKLLNDAYQRAEELKEAGLLYNADEQAIYDRLKARKLDQEYHRLRRAILPDWEKIEANRYERLYLASDKEEREIQRELDEAIEARLKEALAKLREPEAQKSFLAEQIRMGRIPANLRWLKEWLTLCWQTMDWDEAAEVVQRLINLPSEIQSPQSQEQFWKALNEAARAYAEDRVEVAKGYIEEAEEATSDPVLDELRAFLEDWTVQRMLERTRQRSRNSDLSTEDYFEIALAYGMVLQIDKENQEAQKGLEAIEGEIASLLERRCTDAENLRLRIRRKSPLSEGRTKAREMLQDLRALQTIVKHLKKSQSAQDERSSHLSEEAQERLREAIEIAEEKLNLWDEAEKQLAQIEQSIAQARQFPSPLDEEDESGGWDFSEAREILRELQRKAGQDRQLRQLLDSKSQEIEAYEKQAEAFLQEVRKLRTAIQEEHFDEVIRLADALTIQWKRMTADGWEGLETLLYHTYNYPAPHSVVSLRGHREEAEKQRANFREWEHYAEELNKRYQALQDIENELDDDFDMLKSTMPLCELEAQCRRWEETSEAFLQRAEQAPQDPPLSKRAEEMKRQADVEARRHHIADMKERIAEFKQRAQEDYEKFEEVLKRLQRFYNTLPRKIKNGRKEPTEAFKATAKRLHQACKALDPLNANLKKLRGKLEKLRFTFD